MKKNKDILFIILAVLAVGLWGTVLILRSGNAEQVTGEITVVETPDRTENNHNSEKYIFSFVENAEKCQNSLEIVKQCAESVDYCIKQD